MFKRSSSQHRNATHHSRSVSPPDGQPASLRPPSSVVDPDALQQQQQSKSDKDSVKGRRNSFGFLRRSKSSDDYAKQQRQQLQQLQQQQQQQQQQQVEPTSGSRKLRRRRTLEKEQAERQQAELRASQKPPSLPVPTILTATPSNSDLHKLQQSYPPSSFHGIAVTSPPTTNVPPAQSARSAASRYDNNNNNNMASSNASISSSTLRSVSNMETSMPHGSSKLGGPVSPSPSPSDPHSRTESMTNRGRYSYSSTALGDVNSPRRIRRRKDPTPFNILVIGTKGCGKTSFIEFLRKSLTDRVKHRPTTSSAHPPVTNVIENHGSFTSHYLETDMDGERIGVTLYDSKGLERHLADLQLREMASFLESKFSETFQEEQKVLRATGVRDTHIHCVFLILDPSRLDANLSAGSPQAHNKYEGSYEPKPRVVGILDEAQDVDVLRILEGKTTVIPVISKADTITTAHMSFLKRSVWDSLRKVKFDPLEALNLDSDSDSEYGTPEQSILQEDDDEPPVKNGRRHKRGSSGNSDLFPNPPSSKVDGSPRMSPDLLVVGGAPQHADIRISSLSESVELPHLPMSILSPDIYEPGSRGRRFPWGYADPYDPEHCDFVRLKESVFSEWRSELRQASRERWYEVWRTSRLKKRGVSANYPGPNSTTRAVSGAAAYGTLAVRDSHASVGNGYSAARISQIGVAISGDDNPNQVTN